MKKIESHKMKIGKGKKIAIIILIAVLVLCVAFFAKNALKADKTNANAKAQTKVSRRDITATITGSAVVRPRDEYSVNSLVTGEVISAGFEEGDLVAKGQLLYQIDASDIEKDIKNAELAVMRARQNYDDASKSKKESDTANKRNLESAELSKKKAEQAYDDALKSKKQRTSDNEKTLESAYLAVEKAQQNYDTLQKDIQNLYVRSNIAGTIGELYVKQGDYVSTGTNIAHIYNDTYLDLKVPFNEADVAAISTNQPAEVTIIGSGEVLAGTVVRINTASRVKESNMRVREVIIRVKSPGALSASAKATANIGDVYCNDAGTFEYLNEKTITAKSSGTVKNIMIEKGNAVHSGDIILTLENSSLESQSETALITLQDAQIGLEKAKSNMDDYSLDSQIENAKISVEDADVVYRKAKDELSKHAPESQIQNAKIALDEALNNLEKVKSADDDYRITAPISGQIVTKNIKAGDKIDTMSGQEPMAVIYDMSSLEFELMVDELDINKISTGQKVRVTADALNGKEYFGEISNISINGTESNGVTSYPVTIVISEFDDDLLPGMNIDAEIVVGEVKNVTAIPKSAVTRDNIVYVVGEKEDVTDKAPEGYKSVKVVTGLNDKNYIEIISGLSENDIVKTETMNTGMAFPMMGPGGMQPPSGGDRK